MLSPLLPIQIYSKQVQTLHLGTYKSLLHPLIFLIWSSVFYFINESTIPNFDKRVIPILYKDYLKNVHFYQLYNHLFSQF